MAKELNWNSLLIRFNLHYLSSEDALCFVSGGTFVLQHNSKNLGWNVSSYLYFFIVYLTILSVSQSTKRQIVWWLANDELERALNESVVP
jgi:hypothetical protein